MQNISSGCIIQAEMIMKKKKIGFTLIELMIVIAIIGILSAIAFPHFREVRERARQSKCFEFSSLLSRTAELYNIENRKYPEEVEDLRPYLSQKKMPICPSTGSSKSYHFVAFGTDAYGKKASCAFHGAASATWGGS